MRISELAKKLGVKSAEVIAELEKAGIKDKKAASNVPEDQIPALEKTFGGSAGASASKTKKTAGKSTKAGAKKSTKKTAAKKSSKAAPAKEEKADKDEEDKKKAAADAKRKEAEETARKKEAEKKRREEEARHKAEMEKKRVEDDAKRRAEEERKRREAEAKRKAEEEKKRKEEEAKRKAEEEEERELQRLIDEEEKAKAEEQAKQIEVDEAITVKEFAQKLRIHETELIKKLFMEGIAVTVNQSIGLDLAQKIADEMGYTIKARSTAVLAEEQEAEEDKSHLPLRPPVVTVMGHVDHGKTSLLDAIRETDVATGEAGGITQHIGASLVTTPDGYKVTFLDTPGHEAFTALRARGAEVTDLVILVVAADDGVMPQTIEAINHAKAAGVALLVAVNKVDKPDAQPDKVKQELTKYELVPEEWGGQTIFCNVSAKSREGLDTLLEMLQLQAEVLDLRAEPDMHATATVIESTLDKARGPVHNIIVNSGTLKVGDAFIMGDTHGKVRAMISDHGEKLKVAGPSTPVELLGANGLVDPGTVIEVVDNDKKARQIAVTRQEKEREKRFAKQHVNLENVVDRISDGEIAELKLVIKADAQGSVDAVKEMLNKLEFSEVKLHVIHDGVGGITESDISLADASDAIVVGFNVRPTTKARKMAEAESIDVRLYNIIYEITEDIEKSVKGLMKPKIQEKILGRAEVRDIFKISRIGTIAGCMVTDGLIRRNAEARLLRDNVVIHSGNIESLKRFKDDAKEVQSGYECGIGMENYNDIKVGDVIEAFTHEEVAPEL